jgi:hypothetical protein
LPGHIGGTGKEKGKAVSSFPFVYCAVVNAPGAIRTHGPRIRNPVLYPPELRGHKLKSAFRFSSSTLPPYLFSHSSGVQSQQKVNTTSSGTVGPRLAGGPLPILISTKADLDISRCRLTHRVNESQLLIQNAVSPDEQLPTLQREDFGKH